MKQHLVESCSFARSTYENVTTNEKYQPLVEAAKQFHTNKKLNEDAIKKQLDTVKIDEATQKNILTKLQESNNDIELWKFPISKINDMEHPNLNGRVYGRKLWENVINNQQNIWKGGTGLANHPADDEDGDFMKQSIVWLDGYIGEDGLVYGIGTFVGDGGALAKQIIDAGGRIGFSTSGYGDFLANGIEVDPDTYEIDRFADLVLNPSQGVYGDKSDRINNKTESVEENKKENKLTESVENKETIEDLPLSEQLVLKHYKEAIENIDKQPNEDWEKKISNLEDLTKKIKKENLSKVSRTELNNSIKSLTESIMKKTRKALKDGYAAQKICEELDINDISKLLGIKEKLEDFSALEECLNKTTKEMNKYKNLYETKAAYAENEATSAFDTEEKLSETEKKLSETEKKLFENSIANKKLETEDKNLKANVTQLKELNNIKSKTIQNLKGNIQSLNESIKSLKEDLTLKSKKRISNLTTELNEAKERIFDLEEELNSKATKLKNVLSNNKEFQENIDKLTNVNESLRSRVKRLSENNQSLRELFDEAESTINKLQKTKDSQVRKQKATKKVEKVESTDSGEEAVNNFIEELENGPKIDENILFSEKPAKKVEENEDDLMTLKDLFN